MILLPKNLFINTITTQPVQPQKEDLLNKIKSSITVDTYFGPIMKKILAYPESIKGYSVAEELLFFNSKICIPECDDIKKEILEETHDKPAAGHFGTAKTFDLVIRE